MSKVAKKARRADTSVGMSSRSRTSRVYDELEIAMEARAGKIGTNDKEKPESEELTNWSEAELDTLEF